MILVTVPTHLDSAAFLQNLDPEKTKVIEVSHGQSASVFNVQREVLLTTLGTDDVEEYNLILSVSYGYAVRSDMKLGDLVVANRASLLEWESPLYPQMMKGFIPFETSDQKITSPSVFPREIVNSVTLEGGTPYVGDIASIERVLTPVDFRQQFGWLETEGYLAVDSGEGFGISYAGNKLNIPVLHVRGIIGFTVQGHKVDPGYAHTKVLQKMVTWVTACMTTF